MSENKKTAHIYIILSVFVLSLNRVLYTIDGMGYTGYISFDSFLQSNQLKILEFFAWLTLIYCVLRLIDIDLIKIITEKIKRKK